MIFRFLASEIYVWVFKEMLIVRDRAPLILRLPMPAMLTNHCLIILYQGTLNQYRGTLNTIERIHPEQILKKIAILFQGPKIWNSLPNDIKAVTSFYSFKRLMKIFLRDQQNLSTHS